jgi:hypothetical protein
VNNLDRPIEVRYKVAKPTIPQAPAGIPIVPVIKPRSEINHSIPWTDLTTSQFSFNPDTRIVVVTLPAGEALRIAQHNLVDQGIDKEGEFSIEEIEITGPHGQINLIGDEVKRSFVAQSNKLYTLTYHEWLHSKESCLTDDSQGCI